MNEVSLKPRKLTRLEIRQRYPLECAIDPSTHEVTVPTMWRRTFLRPLIVRPGLSAAWLHRDAVPVFARWLALLAEWSLLDRIDTQDGGFVPRLMRGVAVPADQNGLSLHTYGIALDLNASHNPRGTTGAKLGAPGCLLELVPHAYEAGLVWGGDWHGASCDPMHFELGAAVIDAAAAGPGKAR